MYVHAKNTKLGTVLESLDQFSSRAGMPADEENIPPLKLKVTWHPGWSEANALAMASPFLWTRSHSAKYAIRILSHSRMWSLCRCFSLSSHSIWNLLHARSWFFSSTAKSLWCCACLSSRPIRNLSHVRSWSFWSTANSLSCCFFLSSHSFWNLSRPRLCISSCLLCCSCLSVHARLNIFCISCICFRTGFSFSSRSWICINSRWCDLSRSVLSLSIWCWACSQSSRSLSRLLSAHLQKQKY